MIQSIGASTTSAAVAGISPVFDPGLIPAPAERLLPSVLPPDVDFGTGGVAAYDFKRQETPWEIVLDAFIASVCDSPHTAIEYRGICTKACRSLGIGSLFDLNGAMLAGHRGRVVADQRYAPGTKILQLAAFRSFLMWSGGLEAHRLTDRVVRTTLRGLRGVTATPYRLLTDDETARLWKAARRPVDRALLSVTLGAGLRTSEVARLRIADCIADVEGGAALFIRQGKGGKDRTVPMHPEYFAGVAAYLKASRRSLSSPGLLFAPLYPNRPRAAERAELGDPAVLSRLQRMLKLAEIDPQRVGIHGLRHMYAIGVLRSCHNVVVVQKLLGHSNLKTTLRYVDHLRLSELRDALPAPPPSAASLTTNGVG